MIDEDRIYNLLKPQIITKEVLTTLRAEFGLLNFRECEIAGRAMGLGVRILIDMNKLKIVEDA